MYFSLNGNPPPFGVGCFLSFLNPLYNQFMQAKYLCLSLVMTLLLASCGPGKLLGPAITPSPTETLTPTATPTFTPTVTETPSPTPKPAWLTNLETQDPNDTYFKVVDGQPVISVYDANTLKATSVVLVLKSIQVQQTPGGRYPAVLSGNDQGGNLYLFNKNRRSWFPVFLGVAPSEKQFPWVNKSDLPVIAAFLHTAPLLHPDAPPVRTSQRYHTDNGRGYFYLECPQGSIVIGASIQIKDGPGTPDIVMWEVMTKNGLAVLPAEIFDPTNMPYLGWSVLNRVSPESEFGGGELMMITEVPEPLPELRIEEYLIHLPGYLDAVDKFLNTGDFSDLENFILPEVQ
jgi:hypothetical protein